MECPMNVTRHHAEWLSLTEISGPFLSLPVLARAFPQGLDPRDAELNAELHLAHDEFGERGAPKSWLDFVLRRVLEFPDEVLVEGQALPPGLSVTIPEAGETLRPDAAVVTPNGLPDVGKARLLIQRYPSEQKLEAPVAGKLWKTSPATRMAELLRASGTLLGLVTNGEHWMLVHAPPRETTGYASWYANLWREENITFRAFRSLLHARRFFGVAQNETLEALYRESAKDQQEVTDKLGVQVRHAVELLVSAFDRLDRDSHRALLTDVSEERLYNASLTVMMRLVFLFSAEERGLLLTGEATYDQNYALLTLRDILREAADQQGEEVLERRSDAWSRLLALFRAVHGGVEHDAMRLPAYGGTLFDPNTYPFLEGRPPGTTLIGHNTPPAINNRVVLHLLEALQFICERLPGGGPTELRRISFRALDIEQIGHVYEGLLDHTAKRAGEPVLGLKGSKEPELALSELERYLAQGEDALVNYFAEQTGRGKNALKNDLGKTNAFEDRLLLVACEQDQALLARLRPFVGLLRADSFGAPVVIPAGSVFVTAGTDRRSSGTHYTPRSLTEPIVRNTLEPLIYDGPAEGEPRAEWKLRDPETILSLKVCDPAMGSGAFLVQACRYLAERLMEAWETLEAADGEAYIVTPEGKLSRGNPTERLLPSEPEERLLIAKRYVADRCLYGVDKNPMAVEMAKLSLWLTTLQKGKPFSFLDHALKHGDSLVGANLEQIKTFSLSGTEKPRLWSGDVEKVLGEVAELRRELETKAVLGPEDYAEKLHLHAEAEAKSDLLEAIGDALIGCFFSASGHSHKYNETATAPFVGEVAAHPEKLPMLKERAAQTLNGQTPFHWSLEFPEVFLRKTGGFDAFIGNPPFVGGLYISGILGDSYLGFIKYANSYASGTADLASYFFKLNFDRLRKGGTFGFLATNTIAQGDTRAASLKPITKDTGSIYNAHPSTPWPGVANLEVAIVHVYKGIWKGCYTLAERSVSTITALLDDGLDAVGEPLQLLSNTDLSFQGSIVLGMGFVMEPEAAYKLIAQDPKNQAVLFPYINGEDLNSRPDQSPSRWVINFFDWPLERVDGDIWDKATDDERKAWEKSGLAAPDYPDPVAADYPDCLSIVQERVKPERDSLRNNADGKRAKATWWRYLRPRPGLIKASQQLTQVLACSEVTKYLAFAFIPSQYVSSANLDVWASDSLDLMLVLQSSIYDLWARKWSSHLETRLKHSITNSFEKYPLPSYIPTNLQETGHELYTFRKKLLRDQHIGLTQLYNKVHSASNSSKEIEYMRTLIKQMDNRLRDAYGWQDLDFQHGFYIDNKPFSESLLESLREGEGRKKFSEVRFSVSPTARREILIRLLKLNYERQAEEVSKGFWILDKNGKWKVTQGGKDWLARTRKAVRKAQIKYVTNSEETEQLFKPEVPLFGTDY
jgi:hypothetical protein